MGKYEALAIVICAGALMIGGACVFLYLNDRWKAYLARKRGDVREEARLAARDSRAIWIFLLVMVGIILLGTWGAPRNRPGPIRRPAVRATPLTPTAVAGLVVLGSAAAFLFGAFIWFGTRTKKIEAAGRASGASPWLWVLMIMIVGLIIFMSPPKGQRGVRAQMKPYTIPVVIAGLVVGLVGAWALIYFRYNYRHVLRIVQRAQAGDVAGALEELRLEIEAKGESVARAQGMGALLGMQERWHESYKWFLDAERLAGPTSLFYPSILSSQAVTLWKSGRGEDALPLLEKARVLAPHDPLIATNTSLVLLDLGRLDEAREELRRAEELNKNRIIGQGAREIKDSRNREIELCRQKLADRTGAVKDAAGLEEL